MVSGLPSAGAEPRGRITAGIMSVFFFGMGYSSLATARAIHKNLDPDMPIAGTRRNLDNVEEFADAAYRMHVFDGQSPGETLGEDLFNFTPPAGAEMIKMEGVKG